MVSITKKKKRIIDLSAHVNKRGGHFTFIVDNDTIKLIYKPTYRISRYSLDSILYYCESKDGINFTEPKFYQRLKGISYNFCPYKLSENNYIAIGGRHGTKAWQEDHNKIKCICTNTNYDSKSEPWYQLCEYAGKSGKLPFIKDDFTHKCFMNGTYLVHSKDFINWALVKNKPIFSGFNEGTIDRLYGATTFDNLPCIIKKNDLLLNKLFNASALSTSGVEVFPNS